MVLRLSGVVADGRIHRVSDGLHHKKRNRGGWYVLRELPSGLLYGTYGSWWGSRGTIKWNSRGISIGRLSAADRKAIAELERMVEAERAEHHRLGAEHAVALWQAGAPCTSHPYLDRKRVQSYGLRVSGRDELLIPLYDFDGALRGVQRILPHKLPDGRDKFFSRGTPRSIPTFFVIGELDGAKTVAVVEGYATGATIHEATGWPVVVAFDARMVVQIARLLRARLPRAHLVFAGDNDASDSGQKAAQAAAGAAGGVVAVLAGPL